MAEAESTWIDWLLTPKSGGQEVLRVLANLALAQPIGVTIGAAPHRPIAPMQAIKPMIEQRERQKFWEGLPADLTAGLDPESAQRLKGMDPRLGLQMLNLIQQRGVPLGSIPGAMEAFGFRLPAPAPTTPTAEGPPGAPEPVAPIPPAPEGQATYQAMAQMRMPVSKIFEQMAEYQQGRARAQHLKQAFPEHAALIGDVVTPQDEILLRQRIRDEQSRQRQEEQFKRQQEEWNRRFEMREDAWQKHFAATQSALTERIMTGITAREDTRERRQQKEDQARLQAILQDPLMPESLKRRVQGRSGISAQEATNIWAEASKMRAEERQHPIEAAKLKLQENRDRLRRLEQDAERYRYLPPDDPKVRQFERRMQEIEQQNERLLEYITQGGGELPAMGAEQYFSPFTR